MKSREILFVALLALGLAGCNRSETAAEQSVDASTATAEGAVPAAEEAQGDVVAFAGDASAALPPGGGCALDAVDGAIAGAATPVGGQAVLSGWGAPADPAAPRDAVLVLVGAEARYSAPLALSVERPDVAEALQREDARASGFDLRASFTGVAPGQYAVRVRVGGADCDTGKALVVGG